MQSAAIKWHGGKSYLAGQIIGLMPARCANPNAPNPLDKGWCHYVEPYFGGGAVLFANDPEGIGEVVNDINGNLIAFWRAIQSPQEFRHFQRAVELTPCSQQFFEDAKLRLKRDFDSRPWHERAADFFVVNRQSRQALGKDFATLAKTRTRRGMNELPSAWLSAIEGLPEIHARLQRVVILNDDALAVVKQQDGPRTLFYLDPPYLHETREKNSTDAYAHEMTVEQHNELLALLGSIQGRFLLSGYPSDLYAHWARSHEWTRHDFDIANHSSGKDEKERKTECVWRNFA